jgi:class 3 adenylate cyclase
VNLAARLSSEARSGEILVDSRAMKALGERVTGEPRRVILKGIPDPVTAYLISGAGS